MLMAAHELFAMIVQQAQKRDKRSYKVDVQFIEVYAPPAFMCSVVLFIVTTTLDVMDLVILSSSSSLLLLLHLAATKMSFATCSIPAKTRPNSTFVTTRTRALALMVP